MTGVRRANCDCCDVDIWCCYDSGRGWICDEMSQEDCKGYGGWAAETEIACNAYCDDPSCSSVTDYGTASCDTPCDEWNVGNQCNVNTNNCGDGFIEINGEVTLDFIQHDPFCEGNYPCICEIEEWYTELGPCSEVIDPIDYMFIPATNYCGDGSRRLYLNLGYIESVYVLDATPSDGVLTVSFDEDNAGAFWTTNVHGDLIQVTAQAVDPGRVLIRYIYADGACWLKAIPVYKRCDIASAINCVNDQTDETYYSMGLAGDGDSTSIMYGVIDGDEQRIDSGNVATIYFYKPPKCYKTVTGNFDGQDCSVGTSDLWWGATTSDYYQRINTTMAWSSTAMCAGAYTWVTDPWGDAVVNLTILFDTV